MNEYHIACSPFPVEHRYEEFMRQAEEECYQLMDAALPFAEQMLAKHGSFFPFGAAMSATGQIAHVAVEPANEKTQPSDMVTEYQRIFLHAAKHGTYRATCLAYDVRLKLPESGKISDAVRLDLDHRDDCSMIVFLPYRLTGGKLEVGKPFANAGKGSIFAPRH